MIGRWRFARIRGAKRALDEGRLDDALRALGQIDSNILREKELCEELVTRLLARARLAAQAGRYDDALADLDVIATIQPARPEAAILRARIDDELSQRRRRKAHAHQAEHQAEHELAAGHLDSGREAIERIDDPARREQLREQLDIRLQGCRRRLTQAEEALRRGDLFAACRHLADARDQYGQLRESEQFETRLVQACQRDFDRWLSEGDLLRLADGLRAIRQLGSDRPELRRFEQALRWIGQAAGELLELDLSTLRETLHRLAAICGQADWLRQAIRHADAMQQARSALLASPLGLLSPSQAAGGAGPTARAAAAAPANGPVGPADRAIEVGTRPVTLLIDGTGSVRLVRGAVVRIGRAGGLPGIEVPLPADVHRLHAEILCDDGAYVLTARDGTVEVNGRRVRQVLLRDGDRIRLGGSARMVFCQPSRQSESAVLRLSDRCRLAGDVGTVVLFAGTCLVGPQRRCHVHTREGDSTLVVFERGGRLYARRCGRDGRPTGEALPLPAGEPVELGDLRLTAVGAE